MPHKHTRGTRANGASDYDLAPSALAKALPAGKATHTNFSKVTKRKKPRDKDDDTPRAFARLLQFQKLGKLPKALDDGESTKQRKKRKRDEDGESAPASKKKKQVDAVPVPKIMPGERMSEFSARVNQAMPITGLSRKGKNLEGKERQTRLEKKIQRRIAEWRVDEERLKDKEDEEDDIAEEEEAENWTRDQEVVGKSRPGRKGRGAAEVDDEDPWEKLKDAREKPKGLHDVAHAPPDFKKVPKEVFKVKNGARANVADVPKAAGSLRKREELGETRKSIIESYRQLMEGRRNAK